LKRGWVY